MGRAVFSWVLSAHPIRASPHQRDNVVFYIWREKKTETPHQLLHVQTFLTPLIMLKPKPVEIYDPFASLKRLHIEINFKFLSGEFSSLHSCTAPKKNTAK